MKPVLTKHQAVYEELRGRILRAEAAPGQRLVIDTIAKKMGVSAIPVREALQQLQAEGLIEIRPHAGATVASITPAHVEEIFTVLEGLESVAVRRAAIHFSPALKEELLALLKKMDRSCRRKKAEEWSAQNMEFHLAMGRAAGMPLLLEMTGQMLDRWDRVRRHLFHGGAGHRMEAAQQEHRTLFKALDKGDAAASESLIRAHNQGALRHYLKLLKSGGK